MMDDKVKKRKDEKAAFREKFEKLKKLKIKKGSGSGSTIKDEAGP